MQECNLVVQLGSASRKVILRTDLCPGDVCAFTAAVESLHETHAGKFLTDVRTCCDEIFTQNPRITALADAEAEQIDVDYVETVNCSDEIPNVFLRGFCNDLARQLGIKLELTTNRPHVYLSNEEKAVPDGIRSYFTPGRAKFWVVNAGIKPDFTLKQWPVEYFQEVIDRFQERIQFVQVGSLEHDHPSLRGVINFVGKTNHRELIRVCFNADGGLGPITLIQHLFAAFEKPYVALLGGREPVTWVQYPLQTTLHTMGKLPCCRSRACWQSRVVPLNDGSEQDHRICELPVLDMQRPVGKCMAIIKPIEVIRAIEACYEGGALSY